MRASRLLHMLLLLQNRGKQTTATLADELEVSPRTILRDIDALTEAGLPVVVHRGPMGGIELGFEYRTRLTGLSTPEAEVLGLIVSAAPQALSGLGIDDEVRMTLTKLVESFPDQTRENVRRIQKGFAFPPSKASETDPRIPALVEAIRSRQFIRLQIDGSLSPLVKPRSLTIAPEETLEIEEADGSLRRLKSDTWGRLNISARRF